MVISILKKMAKLISILIAFILLLSLLAFISFNYLNSPPSLPSSHENFIILEVRSGESAISVGNRLEEAGIIRNRRLWQLISRLKDEHIKTGSYRIELPASQLHIHAVLVEGLQDLVMVTIPEGVTLNRAARIFEEAGICNAEDFLAAASSQNIRNHYSIPGETMEGYLFPDTYLFPYSFPAEQVVRTMADTFFSRLAEIAPEVMTMGIEELNNRVIMASIVEREYRINEEASLMAGVFYNRLRINMALQSCATVEYIITEIQGKPHPSVILYRDLEIRDPYNTYLRPGLPPGPISAPGAIALLASFYPAQTEYFYFRLIDSRTGQHYFSRTLDEHNHAGTLYEGGNS